ncbi:diiron oxygenase [Frankia sp. Cj3]|uniref:diiron oxygenase n=1 Tax=Frankia sp. Cj3 TaxID=2880976 RepID=UPI001EF46E10|nr:diiron oxygenase [Frankia sp. Cj3]
MAADRILDRWYEAARVRCGPRRKFAEEQETGKALFAAREMPELDHPTVAERGTQMREFLLAQRLYQYLQFTVHVESRIINRALELLANGHIEIGSLSSWPIRLNAYQIYTDEAFHALSNLDLIDQVARVTGIEPCRYSFDRVIMALDGPMRVILPGHEHLGQLMQAVVFETALSSILDILPRDPTVHSVVRAVVADHAADERRHHAYFSRVFPEIWRQLDGQTRTKVAHYLPYALRGCLEPDLAHAAHVLLTAGLSSTDAEEVLAEKYWTEMIDTRIREWGRYTLNLFRNTGVLDVPGASEKFAAAGL